MKPIAVPGLHELSRILLAADPTLYVEMPCLSLATQAAQEGWHQLRCPKPSNGVTGLSVFTDGSQIWHWKEQRYVAAWSFVVVRRTQCGDEILGFRHGILQEDWKVFPWSGLLEPQADHPDAFAAELYAIVHALCWLLVSPDFQVNTRTKLWIDSQSALFCANGQWSSKHRQFVTTTLRPLWTAATVMGNLESAWVRAHNNHPINDLADHAAKMAARMLVNTPWTLQPLGAFSAAVPWLWLMWNNMLNDTGPTFENDQIFLPDVGVVSGKDQVVLPKTAHCEVDHMRVCLKFSTYNAGTLYSWGQARRKASQWKPRKELLLTQFGNHSVLALQETRGRTTGMWYESGVVGCSSAANGGQGGCDLWFNTVRRQIGSALLRACSKLRSSDLWTQPPDMHVAWFHDFFSQQLSQHFPPAKRHKKGSWLSSTTQDMLANSRWCRHQARQIAARFRIACLRHMLLAWGGFATRRCLDISGPLVGSSCLQGCFRAWAALSACTSFVHPPSPTWHRRWQFAVHRYIHLASRARQTLQSSLRHDEATMIAKAVDEHRSRIGDTTPCNLWTQLRRHLPKFRSLCTNRPVRFTATCDSFLAHFAQIEEAKICTVDEICETVSHQAIRSKQAAEQWQDMQPWIDAALHAGHAWTSRCQRALRFAAVWAYHQRHFHWQLHVGRVTLPADLVDAATEPKPHPCSFCEASFDSHKALSVRLKQQHGIAAEVRSYMTHPTICASCLMECHSTQRLRQHLQYHRDQCLRHLQDVLTPMSPQEVSQMPTVRQPQAHYRLACFRVPGLLLPTRAQWDAVRCVRRTPEAGATLWADWMDWASTTLDVGDPSTWSAPTLDGTDAVLAETVWDAAFEVVVERFGARDAALLWDHIRGCVGAPSAGLSTTDGVVIPRKFVLWLQPPGLKQQSLRSIWQHFVQIYNLDISFIELGIDGSGTLSDLGAPATRAFWLQMIHDAAVVGLYVQGFMSKDHYDAIQGLPHDRSESELAVTFQQLKSRCSDMLAESSGLSLVASAMPRTPTIWRPTLRTETFPSVHTACHWDELSLHGRSGALAPLPDDAVLHRHCPCLHANLCRWFDDASHFGSTLFPPPFEAAVLDTLLRDVICGRTGASFLPNPAFTPLLHSCLQQT
eukprot:Skav228006  [mRNA]  locus=scaffold390:483634:489307:- [translate_table: standard]